MKTISLHDAAAMIRDGARLMIGGFMGVGTPERVVDELVRQRKRDLTVSTIPEAFPLPALSRRRSTAWAAWPSTWSMRAAGRWSGTAPPKAA
jgi:acyl-CoA hydrolase